MSFFVNVRTDRVILSEGKEAFPDLYDACGRAALLASDLTDRYPTGLGTTVKPGALAVEVITDGGKVVLRLPIEIRRRP